MLSLQLYDDLHTIQITQQKLARHAPARKVPKQIPHLEFLRKPDLPGFRATERTLSEALVEALRHLEDHSPRFVHIALLAAHARKDSIATQDSEIVDLGRRLQRQSDCRLSPHDHTRLSKIATPRTAVTSGQLA